MTSIGGSAFSGCSGLTSVTIPNSVTSIGGSAFSGCSGLTSINIPNSVTSISSSAFRGCSGLTSITIPNSVTSIGNYAFSACSSLTSITIPNSVTSIGEEAFRYCSGLTSITIPNSVTSIGIYAFSACSSLTSITIPNSVTSIGDGAFSGCSGLTAITIPNSVTAISSYAFSGCSGLTAITIPNSVTSIGNEAFSGCSGLTAITIPNSVTSIGNEALSGCSGLTSVTVNWSRPLAGGGNGYTDIKKTATLYVPKGTAMMYMAAPGWSEFVNIQEFEDEEDAHYITIRLGDGGVLKQSVEVGNTYVYAVAADEDWEVSTVTFDGKDMTSQLLNGQFSTPVITGNSELNVVFRQTSTRVNERKVDSAVKVYANGRSVTVRGAEEDVPVSIFSTNGMLVDSSTGNATFTLGSGIYIVKVGTETFKVSL